MPLRGEMMKKLLILFIVLSLATEASAVSVSAISGSAPVILMQGTTITVDLVSDTDMTGIGDTEEGYAGWWITADAGVGLPSNGTFDSFLDTVTSNALSRLFAISTATSGYIAPGDPFFSFSVTAPSTNGDYDVIVNFSTAYASFWDDTATDRYADLVSGTNLTITVIPEPMTIALLGLGGLLLLGRRSKRAGKR